jgi:hypothetical protein
MEREQAIQRLVQMVLETYTGAFDRKDAQEIVDILNTAAGKRVCCVDTETNEPWDDPWSMGMAGIMPI